MVGVNAGVYLGLMGWDLNLLWITNGRGFGDPPRSGRLQCGLRSAGVNRTRCHDTKVYELVVMQVLA